MKVLVTVENGENTYNKINLKVEMDLGDFYYQ